jgi:hypothetical protein
MLNNPGGISKAGLRTNAASRRVTAINAGFIPRGPVTPGNRMKSLNQEK